MPEFRGPKNLHVGADSTVDPKTEKRTDTPAWAQSVYDADGREYVIKVSDADTDRFRAIADEYGFREVQSSAEVTNSEE